VGPRVRIIAIAIALWSVATTLCGFARSFTQLFLARIGVGVGEAGCSPAAYSLLAGYYGPAERSGALAIYAAGIPLGSALGFIGGGLIAQAYGWRQAFWVFGAPGILLALVVAVYVREPRRGAAAAVRRPPPLPVVLSGLRARPSFWHATLGTSLLAAAGFAAGTWLPSFLVRSHGMALGAVGMALAALTLTAVPASIFAGRLANRWVKRDRRFHVWLPAAALVVATPFSVAGLLLPAGQVTPLGFAVPNVVLVMLLFVAPTAASAIYAGPVLAAVQTMTPENMRATTVAIFLFATNLIGMGVGPVFVGVLSDTLRATVGADSLRWALLVTVGLNLWAAAHYQRAARYLEADLDRPWEPKAAR
jgi:MFS family permease